jgi:signal recognition particle subunit SRP54
VADIKARALGQEVMGSLTPGQQVVKIVNESLTQLMGETHQDLNLAGEKPVAVMLVGLQGRVRPPRRASLSVMLRKTGKQPYLVPADVYRPAAIDQLEKAGWPVGGAGFRFHSGHGSGQNLSGCPDGGPEGGLRHPFAGYRRAASYR